MIDPVTGLPDLTSDVYQIPLNTDSLPYKDLQAEKRLPRQPLLPDDIIPTIALLTGLDSDNTGQVVHTDDNHAAKVYVVNQPTPVSGGGGGGSVVPNHQVGPTNFWTHSSDDIFTGMWVTNHISDLITDVTVVGLYVPSDNSISGSDSYGFMFPFLHGDVSHVVFNLKPCGFVYVPAGQGSSLYAVSENHFDTGLLPSDLGFTADDSIELRVALVQCVLRVSAYAAWRQ